MTRAVSLRIRLAAKMIRSLPPDCRSGQPQERPGFKAFQDFLIRQTVNPLVAPTPGLRAIKLDPPMSPALENVRLSPDAKLLLAQDELQIHVLSRTPLKLLFSIDAPGAQMARFTPDSADVAFYYSGLCFEDWNVATRKRASVLDFADYADCLQASLSPDGRTFACFSRNYGDTRFTLRGSNRSYGWLKLSDLRTGKMLYENTNFYLPNFGPQAPSVARRAIDEPRQASVAWSQDGRYFLAASGTAALGFDLKESKTVAPGNSLAHLYESRIRVRLGLQGRRAAGHIQDVLQQLPQRLLPQHLHHGPHLDGQRNPRIAPADRPNRRRGGNALRFGHRDSRPLVQAGTGPPLGEHSGRRGRARRSLDRAAGREAGDDHPARYPPSLP
jgi:hypothetical protein